MIKLIKNEMFKLLHRKSFYIFFLVIVLFMFFVNYVSSKYTYAYDEFEVQSWEIINQNDIISSIDAFDYESLSEAKAELFMLELRLENGTSWVYNYLNENLDTISNYYYMSYTNSESEEYLILEDLMDLITSNVINDNWEEYIENQIIVNEEIIKNLESTNEIEYYEYVNNLHNYRLENNISFDNNYLSDAMINVIELKYYQLNSENDTYFDEIAMYEYVIENEVDALSNYNFITNMKSFLYNYAQFIILFVLVIAGSILASEINKGTIKSLLIAPYSRTKILIAKYIAVIIMAVLVILAMLVVQTALGAIFYDIKDFNIPVLTYDYSAGKLYAEHILFYLGKQIIVYMPTIMFLSLIALTVTIIVSNSAIAVVGTFMLYIIGEIVNSLIIMHDLEYLKYLITLNWDFTTYLYGNVNAYECITLGFSIVIYIVYFVIISLLALKIFKIKNISNE